MALVLAVAAVLVWGGVPVAAQEGVPITPVGLPQIDVHLDPGKNDVQGQRPAPRFPASQLTEPLWRPAHAPEPAQIVSFYGPPGVPVMGVLGHGPPAVVAERVAVWAEHYDRLNGPRGAVPAFHLITGVAQAGTTRGRHLALSALPRAHR